MQSYSQNSQDERVQKRTARAVVYVASANDQAVLAKIHNTYSTSAYNFNWPVPRTHTYVLLQLTYTSTYFFNWSVPRAQNTHVYFNWSVPGTIHTSTYTVLGSPYLNTLKLCVHAYVFPRRPKRSVLPYVTNCHLPTMQNKID